MYPFKNYGCNFDISYDYLKKVNYYRTPTEKYSSLNECVLTKITDAILI